MAIKLAEQTNGPHIFMRLRLDSGRVEEIDAYTTEKGWHYVTSADRTPEIRLRIIAAFHRKDNPAGSLHNESRCWRSLPPG